MFTEVMTSEIVIKRNHVTQFRRRLLISSLRSIRYLIDLKCSTGVSCKEWKHHTWTTYYDSILYNYDRKEEAEKPKYSCVETNNNNKLSHSSDNRWYIRLLGFHWKIRSWYARWF